jgi:4-aminobutyrate aminotransferase-like enzyme
MPDPYRGRHPGNTIEAAIAYASDLADVVAALVAKREPPAAFICEPIMSCAGQIEPPPTFLSRAFDTVRGAGGLCIADEVQVGFGRVGDGFWAFETQGVTPDIVTLGKPIGNGHPMAAVVTTADVAEAFANGMEYFSTFGGNPVSAAVGLAVLREIDDHDLQENARVVGGELLTGLRELMAAHPMIGDCRGRGLFLGIELVRDITTKQPAPETATYLVNRACEQGVLISTDGPDHNVIKIKPPLVFGRREATHVLNTLQTALSELA